MNFLDAYIKTNTIRCVRLLSRPLPIARPVPALAERQRTHADAAQLVAVVDPAHVLAPCHLAGIEVQVVAADPVMLAVLGPAQAGEEALGLIGARPGIGEGEAVIDPLRLIPRMQAVPGRSLIGIDRAAGLDTATDRRHRLLF